MNFPTVAARPRGAFRFPQGSVQLRNDHAVVARLLVEALAARDREGLAAADPERRARAEELVRRLLGRLSEIDAAALAGAVSGPALAAVTC